MCRTSEQKMYKNSLYRKNQNKIIYQKVECNKTYIYNKIYRGIKIQLNVHIVQKYNVKIFDHCTVCFLFYNMQTFLSLRYIK